MNYNLLGFIILLILSGGIAIVIYIMVSDSLRRLIDEVAKMPSSTTFYVRVFIIGLTLTFLSAALSQRWIFKEDAAFMEYVWNVADGISSGLGHALIFLSVYLILVTILISVLLRHDK